MSLLKQLFLAICLFLVVAFSGSFVSSVENSREQLRGQLRSHAQAGGGAVQSFQHPLRRAGMGVAGRQGWDAVHGIPAPRSDEQNYRAGLRRNV